MAVEKDTKQSKDLLKDAWVDPDAAPELDDQWFEGADQHHNGVLVKRGKRSCVGRKRPSKANE